MNILIQGGRIIDPASGLDNVGDVAIAEGHIVGLGRAPDGFKPERIIDARGCVTAPGLVDVAVRLREPGHEHEGMLASELAAAVAGGVTSLACLPDTDPVLDEPGLVDMLRFRARKLHGARVFPIGALTRGLAGQVLTEMVQLFEAGCVGFGQAEVPLADTQVLQRALQYAASFGYTVWLRPQDMYLGRGIAASGALATRMGLSGVPVAAETIALHTIFELIRSTRTRVHLCRISSAAGVELVRRAKAEGLPVSCDASIHSLHLTDVDIGYFDSRARLTPPLRQQADRAALRAGLADGTVDLLVSDHTPVGADEKALPFSEATPGATGLELLLSLTLKWADEAQVPLPQALGVVTHRSAELLGASARAHQASPGRLELGCQADLCVFDPLASWRVTPQALRSQGKHTLFDGYELPGRVHHTVVGGRLVFSADPAS